VTKRIFVYPSGQLGMGLVFFALGLWGCGVSEGDFIAGADADPCIANVPVCQTTAGCAMGETTYIEGDFPGVRNFIVTTPADTTITVKIFFKTRIHPGEDLEIRWYEPGCSNYHRYESGNIDLFSKAGSDRVFSQSRQVREAGDHLIDIYSDATAHYFVRVELDHPD
jgi:hypothetical protein